MERMIPMLPETRKLLGQIAVRNLHLPATVIGRIWELSEGGLSDHEIAAQTGLALHLIRTVLRGGATC
jgi:hypothetical protein